MLDIKIVGGNLVDGMGRPAQRGDLGIRGGRIAAIGRVDEAASHTIDADGRVVSPGFVDAHTHYDAQVFWDGALSPSCFHGVTTVIGGNCGFTIAPLAGEAAPYLMRMLARVEGMPLDSLRAGVPWDWHGFGEYLDRLERRVGINAGFLVGHSALRRVVMGERAIGERASADDLESMCSLLARSLADGGLGFSSTLSPTHNDAEGQPVPSRHASREEMLALSRVCAEFPGTMLGFLPGIGDFGAEATQLMAEMSLAARAPLAWNALVADRDTREIVRAQLAATDYARERGAEVVALAIPQPMTVRINLLSGFGFDALPGWNEPLGLPVDERMLALRDPDLREALAKSAERAAHPQLRALADWAALTIVETFDPANEKWKGLTVGEMARELGKSPLDAMLDLALSEGLRTSFLSPTRGDDAESWAERGKVWLDDRTVIGGSDAGAHLDMIDSFAFSTQVLSRGVREHGLLGLEQAVHLLTERPATLCGLRERGRLQPGWWADVVVFDPAAIRCGPIYTRFDLPAGAGRLYADAEGIDAVIVNGVEIVRGGAHTGQLPGTVLRAGRDTQPSAERAAARVVSA